MAEDRNANVVLRILVLNTFGKAHSAAGDRTFGNKHNRRVLALSESVFDEFGKLVNLGRNFWNDGSFATRSDGTVESQEAGVATHNFDEE